MIELRNVRGSWRVMYDRVAVRWGAKHDRCAASWRAEYDPCAISWREGGMDSLLSLTRGLI